MRFIKVIDFDHRVFALWALDAQRKRRFEKKQKKTFEVLNGAPVEPGFHLPEGLIYLTDGHHCCHPQ